MRLPTDRSKFIGCLVKIKQNDSSDFFYGRDKWLWTDLESKVDLPLQFSSIASIMIIGFHQKQFPDCLLCTKEGSSHVVAFYLKDIEIDE